MEVPAWFTPGLLVPAVDRLRDGHVRLVGTSLQAWDRDMGGWASVTPAKVNKAKQVRPWTARVEETRALLEVRDAALSVRDAQDTSSVTGPGGEGNADVMAGARAELGRVYDEYRARFGPIERPVTWLRTPSAKEKRDRYKELEDQYREFELPVELTPAERRAHVIPADLIAAWKEEAARPEPLPFYPHLVDLKDDPALSLLLTLEDVGADGSVTKSSFFDRDLAIQAPVVLVAETPQEAVAVATGAGGTVDLDRVADLLGLPDAQTAFTTLGPLVYRDPETRAVVPAHLYLSGDVRAKRAAALDALKGDASYVRNVEALDVVVPEVVPLADAAIRPGVRWLGEGLHREFTHDVLRVSADLFIDKVYDTWQITGAPRSAFAANEIRLYGTARKSPAELLEDVMNNRPTTVWDRDGDQVWVNRAETAAARAKQTAIEDAFTTWLAADPARAAKVEAQYNALLNSHVPTNYAGVAEHMVFPGMSTHLTLHPHQKAAVARAITSPSTLLDHVVGAGKTLVMATSCMEMRRLGIARAPWIVVPNHMVGEVGRQWQSAYPNANILLVETGISGTDRDRVLLKVGTGDYDGVIVGRSTFKAMPLSPARQAVWMREELDELDAIHAAATEGKENRSYIKKVETAKKRIETKFARLADDAGKSSVGFEHTGCDVLFVDEAHGYKNLARQSPVADLAHTGADLATDLDYKIRALREARADANHQGAPVVVFATGTPVANAMAESWVMAHYLAPERLEAIGAQKVDGWARQFAVTASKLELGPDGRTWRVKDRIAKYVNLPELTRLNAEFTDHVGRDVLAGRIPALAGGTRTTIVREASEQVREYINDLAYRANHLPGDPKEDNLLKIGNDGRLVALDPRLRGLPADPDGGRIAAVAAQIMAVANRTGENQYTDITTGNPSPILGALQIVFCDRSTPSPGEDQNVYEWLKADLIARGMDPDQIAFIHDAVTDADRLALYKRANDGHLRVLIGSTEKMGTGTNVQARAVAIHHVDVPWRPADLEQREGRAFRQGNQNSEVEVFQYVTQGTYDAVSWGTVTRKAEFIAQINTATTREMADTGDDLVISAALASAIATGDDRVMKRVEIAEEVTRLEYLESGWTTARQGMRADLNRHTALYERETATAEALTVLAGQVRPTAGEAFTYTAPNGQRTRERTTAGETILELARRAVTQGAAEYTPAGMCGGIVFELRVGGQTYTTADGDLTLVARDPDGHETIAAYIVTKGTEVTGARGLIQSIEYFIAGIPAKADAATHRARNARAAMEAAQQALDAETINPHTDALTTARAELEELDKALQIDNDPEAGGDRTVDPYVGGQALWNTVKVGDRTVDGIQVWPGDLRTGDVILLHGEQWITMAAAANGDHTLTKYEQPGEQITQRLWGHQTVIARQRDTLTPIEALAAHLAPNDQVTHQELDVKDGDRITVCAHLAAVDRHHEASERRGRTIPAWTQYKADRGSDPILVTGVVTKVNGYSNGWPQTEAWKITTDSGEHLLYPEAGTLTIRHDVTEVIAPDIQAGLDRFANLLPGDRATGITNTKGMPHRHLPATVTAIYTGSREYWQPGAEPWSHYRGSGAMCETVAPGLHLTDEQAAAVFGDQWRTQRADSLRIGDRVIASDIGGSSHSPATVTGISRGSNVTITYRIDGHQADSEKGRKAGASIPIMARRIGACTGDELRRLAGGRSADENRAATLTPGTRVFVRPDKNQPQGFAGTITDAGAKPGTKWGRAHDCAYIVLTPDQGQEDVGTNPVTITYWEDNKEPAITTYPAGAAIPAYIDPHDGTPHAHTQPPQSPDSHEGPAAPHIELEHDDVDLDDDPYGLDGEPDQPSISLN